MCIAVNALWEYLPINTTVETSRCRSTGIFLLSSKRSWVQFIPVVFILVTVSSSDASVWDLAKLTCLGLF